MLTIGGLCWLCRMPLHLSRHGICSYCLRQLALPPACPRCGLPSASRDVPCGRCLRRPPPWQALVAVTDFRPPLSHLVHQLKFSQTPELAPVLARLLLLRWLDAHRHGRVVRPHHLISVPLHRHRQWRRGYNQSDLLAVPLARWLGCGYRKDTLQRLRATPAQRTLTAARRRRNLRGAFDCRQNLAGCHVALLDDVVTTGSTVAEICALLNRAGVASIQIWCLCRTL
ncbi:DNA utilization protein GntX [Chimaeribacter californicus]|uniref:DNA utilization protein GntX n=1 Tax=Chimaeribacter californicus TaxID=2060067 RepID=A0A2N5E4N7_9GAMM|nr:DNA utilization protein GntX [Chimaeribacter californicus]PLR35936.1 DNA utilization protein GntX [Chimaeribacter californicus]